jgi:hypothetical protein
MTRADFIFEALKAGVIAADPDTGAIFGPRFRPGVSRGCLGADGYLVSTLHFAGTRKQIKNHQVVWIAAHGPIPAGFVPDHINRDKTDNRLANLRLVTPLENSRNRRTYRGEENPAARITRDVADEIRKRRRDGLTFKQLAGEFSVSKSLAFAIVRGALWV